MSETHFIRPDIGHVVEISGDPASLLEACPAGTFEVPAPPHDGHVYVWQGDKNGQWVQNDPVPSTDPNDYPLEPYQFWAQVEIAGLTSQINTAVDNIADLKAKAVAKAKLDYSEAYERSDPLFSTIGAALNMTDEQIDALWMQATEL